MLLFSVYVIFNLLYQQNNAHQLVNVENIFNQNVTVEPGDVLQCEITKTNQEYNNDFHLVTQSSCVGDGCYIIQPVTAKCYSFKVRAKSFICVAILLNSVPYTDKAYKLEVILDNVDKSYIRETRTVGTIVQEERLITVPLAGLVNDREYRGFWIRWLDDELLEVGRESETIPFMHYRFLKKLQINYVGIYTCGRSGGSWIINREPKCPRKEAQITTKSESSCFILK